MKKTNRILLGIFSLMVLFSLINISSVAATPTQIEVPAQDTYQTRLQAGELYQFRFRLRTQLAFRFNVNVDANLDCDAMKIGSKDFALEVDSTGDLQMNMTCTREQEELGLMDGYTYQVRNRNMRYQEGFCVRIQTNATEQYQIQAKLKIKATNQNQLGTWAYYDEASEQWVSVPTAVQDGYLIAQVDHFSYWTILTPDLTLIIVIGIGVGAGVLVAVLAIYYWRKRRD